MAITIMRHSALVSLAYLSIVVSPNAVAAYLICPNLNSEPDDWTSMQLEYSDVVLIGEVISTVPPPEPNKQSTDSAKSRFDVATSMAKLLEQIETGSRDDAVQHVEIVSVDVLRSWKQSVAPRVEVKNRYIGSHYGFPLLKGEKYLIFGIESDDGSYWISTTCKLTRRAVDAGPVIEALDRLTSSQ